MSTLKLHPDIVSKYVQDALEDQAAMYRSSTAHDADLIPNPFAMDADMQAHDILVDEEALTARAIINHIWELTDEENAKREKPLGGMSRNLFQNLALREHYPDVDHAMVRDFSWVSRSTSYPDFILRRYSMHEKSERSAPYRSAKSTLGSEFFATYFPGPIGGPVAEHDPEEFLDQFGKKLAEIGHVSDDEFLFEPLFQLGDAIAVYTALLGNLDAQEATALLPRVREGWREYIKNWSEQAEFGLMGEDGAIRGDETAVFIRQATTVVNRLFNQYLKPETGTPARELADNIVANAFPSTSRLGQLFKESDSFQAALTDMIQASFLDAALAGVGGTYPRNSLEERTQQAKGLLSLAYQLMDEAVGVDTQEVRQRLGLHELQKFTIGGRDQFRDENYDPQQDGYKRVFLDDKDYPMSFRRFSDDVAEFLREAKQLHRYAEAMR